jgi:hypothetical protein
MYRLDASPDEAGGRAALSPAELLERADLAGQARILTVLRAKDDATPHVARLQFETLTKGKPKPRNALDALLPFRRIVDVKMKRVGRDPQGRPLPGQWTPGYRAGDRVMTHLVWDEQLGGYTTLCWNAVWQIPA